MKYIHIIVFIFLGLIATASAQQPDRWRNLIIDVSTPEDAIEILGKPKSDKIGDRSPSYLLYHSKLFIKDIGKTMRMMKWKKVDGFNEVILRFNANKLAMIRLEPKKISAETFAASYSDVSFDFGGQSPGSYELKGESGKTYIFAAVSKGFGGLFATALSRTSGGDTNPTNNKFIGQVKMIEIISKI